MWGHFEQKTIKAKFDRCADTLTEALQAATAATAKIRQPCAHAKLWWDDDLARAADRVSEARKEQKRHHDTINTFNGDIRTCIRKARNFFKRLCRIKKRDWVNEKLQQASTDDIWVFQNWSKGTRNYPTPPISRGEGVPRAVTHQDKCDALRFELYQPPPQLEADHTPDLENLREDDLPYVEVTFDEVGQVITSTSSPGYSQGREMGMEVRDWPTIHPGSHAEMPRSGVLPEIMEEGNSGCLKEARKTRLLQPKSLPAHNPLGVPWEVLEKIVVRRLTYLAGKHNLVPANQFGGRSSSSTIDALLTFTNDVQCAWNHKLVTSALTFDTKGYFDFVNYNRLLSELRRKHIPLAYVKWVASFLFESEAAICIDGKRGAMGHVENGIPKGSPISPILAAFYTAELLE